MVAYRMFSRWRQENYFKYMAEEFALALKTERKLIADTIKMAAYQVETQLLECFRTTMPGPMKKAAPCFRRRCNRPPDWRLPTASCA